MNQIPDGLERELAPRDGRWCRMQARRDDRNPQHGAATIIDIGVSVSMPQATHRNQRKAPSVEWMGRIRDRDLFGPSILRPNRGIKKWDRKRHRCRRSRHRQGADLEQLVPVTAGAGQPGHLDAEHQADLVQANLRHQALEAETAFGGSTRSAEIVIGGHDKNCA